MSTIAKPRESSVTGSRRLPTMSTPTSSSRPSLDSPRGLRSESASPNRGPGPAVAAAPRRNRAALREYYNLKKEEKEKADDADSVYSINDYSEVQVSEMDREDFDGEAFVKSALETQSLEELLKTYNSVLTDIRALDAEKKALVYDNYSKLISATETIRKMRANMDPLNPMASTLDPAIAQIYERANSVKQELRASMSDGQRKEAEMSPEEKKVLEKRRKMRDVVKNVLEAPERVRILVSEEKEEEARMEWEKALALLEKWQEAGQGGQDVQDCIDAGEAALSGEPLTENNG